MPADARNYRDDLEHWSNILDLMHRALLLAIKVGKADITHILLRALVCPKHRRSGFIIMC